MYTRKNIDKWYIWLQRLMGWLLFHQKWYSFVHKNRITWEAMANHGSQLTRSIVNQFNVNLWFLIYSFVIRFFPPSALFHSLTTCFIELMQINKSRDFIFGGVMKKLEEIKAWLWGIIKFFGGCQSLQFIGAFISNTNVKIVTGERGNFKTDTWTRCW